MRFSLIILFNILLPLQILLGGILIEVCGIDGAGKTTFSQDMYQTLTDQGKKVIVIRPLRGEPSVFKFLDQMESLKKSTENEATQDRIERFKKRFFPPFLFEQQIICRASS